LRTASVTESKAYEHIGKEAQLTAERLTTEAGQTYDDWSETAPPETQKRSTAVVPVQKHSLKMRRPTKRFQAKVAALPPSNDMRPEREPEQLGILDAPSDGRAIPAGSDDVDLRELFEDETPEERRQKRKSLLDDVPLSIKNHEESAPAETEESANKRPCLYKDGPQQGAEKLPAIAMACGIGQGADRWLSKKECKQLSNSLGINVLSARSHVEPRRRLAKPVRKCHRLTLLANEVGAVQACDHPSGKHQGSSKTTSGWA